MRTFIAVELPASLSTRLEREVNRLKKTAPIARWLRRDSLHLTLCFLGEVMNNGMPPVEAALAKVAKRHAPFTLEAAGSGTFGPLEGPKVLWVALKGDLGKLSALQGDLARELAAIGHPPEFDVFQPHITLARSKNPGGDAELSRCADMLRGESFETWRVAEVSLFDSHTDKDGMVHSRLSHHALALGQDGRR